MIATIHARKSTEQNGISGPEAGLSPIERRSVFVFALVWGVPLLYWLIASIDSYRRTHGMEPVAGLLTAVATVLIAIFTGAYVWFTYGLWRSSAKQTRISQRTNEARLM